MVSKFVTFIYCSSDEAEPDSGHTTTAPYGTSINTDTRLECIL